jgi:hypothetical protein
MRFAIITSWMLGLMAILYVGLMIFVFVTQGTISPKGLIGGTLGVFLFTFNAAQWRRIAQGKQKEPWK